MSSISRSRLLASASATGFGLVLCGALGGAASRPGGFWLGLPPSAVALMAVVVGAAVAWYARPSAAGAGAALLPVAALQLLGVGWPGVWAFSGPIGLAFGLGALVVVLAERSPRVPGVVFFGVVLIVHLVVAFRVQRAVGPQGDEPHYLMVAESLLRDGDLSLENDYAEGRYRAFFHEGKLEPHYRVRGKGGEIYSLHALGLSLLVLPVYALGGYPAASFFMAFLAALLAWEIRALVLALFGSRGLADATGWIVALSPPLVHFCGLVFSEVPAALLLAVALRRILSEGEWTTREAMVTAAALAFCPWLNVRYALPAVLLLAAALVWRRGSAPCRAGLVLIPALSAAGLMLYHHALYGFFDPRRVYGRRPEFALSGLGEGLPGILLDQEFGLLAYAPVFALVLPGVASLLRTRWKVAVIVGGCIGAVLFTAATWHMWRGGFNPPARFLVPVVPFLAIGVAAALRKGISAPAAVLIGWGLFTGLAGAASPQLVHRDRDETGPLWRERSGAVCWSRLLPGYVLQDQDRHTLALLWGGVLVAAVLVRRERASATGLVATTIAGVLAAGLAAHLSHRTGEGREQTRVLGTRALAVPGYFVSTAVRAEWKGSDLPWGPVFEPHRHPDGAAIVRRLRLGAGRYELGLEGRILTDKAPSLRIESDARGVGPRLVPFESDGTGLVARFSVEGDHWATLSLQGGGALVVDEVWLESLTRD